MIKKDSSITIGLAITLGAMIILGYSTFASKDYVDKEIKSKMEVINLQLEYIKEAIEKIGK